MKDNRATRTSKLPQFQLKRASNKPSKEERERMAKSLKSWNVYGGSDDAS